MVQMGQSSEKKEGCEGVGGERRAEGEVLE
jgi:hypothetical protein